MFSARALPTSPAHLRANGATILEVLPMNLSEIFLELAGKESHVPLEAMA